MKTRPTVEHEYTLTKGPPQNPHKLKTFLGNNRLKAHDVQQPYSKWEREEFMRCKNSCEYFVAKYMKIIHGDYGLVDFVPYPYQRKMWKTIDDNRFTIMLSSRQSGKSTGFVGYLMWMAVFHKYQNIAIVANKLKLAKELLAKVMLALQELPFFLQPGIVYFNKEEIKFSTETNVRAFSAASDSLVGFSPTLCLLDEFAVVKNDQEFYTATYPAITAGKKTKIIIVSTARGIGNTFYRIWQGAVQGVNKYVPIRVDWWEVPDRDEEWKKETIANTSEAQFAREYGNSFTATSTTLIDGATILGLKAQEPIETVESTNIYEHPVEDHSYIITVDCAKGRGLDHSAFSVFDVSVHPIKQVATYKDNEISPLVFPEVINKIGRYFNNAYSIVEANDIGCLVYNKLMTDLEYPDGYSDARKNGETFGLEMTKRVKSVGCSNLKDLVEENKLEIVDADTIKELSAFEAKGSSYEAREGENDDLVMTLVSFAWFTDDPNFEYFANTDIREMLSDQREERIKTTEDILGKINDDGIIFEEVSEEKNQKFIYKYVEGFGLAIDTEMLDDGVYDPNLYKF